MQRLGGRRWSATREIAVPTRRAASLRLQFPQRVCLYTCGCRRSDAIRIPEAASGLPVDRLAEPLDVADGEEPPDARVGGAVVAITFHRRDVIRTTHAVEANLAIGLHACQHVSLPVVVEGLDELLRGPAHVAKV